MQFEDHVSYLKAIFWLEDPKKQLGAELIETVPGMVIGHRENEQASARLHHRHAICNADRKIEDVFQCATVDHHVKLIMQVWTDWLIHIVNQITTFVTRTIQRVDLLRPEELAEQLINVPLPCQRVLVDCQIIVGRQPPDLRR